MVHVQHRKQNIRRIMFLALVVCLSGAFIWSQRVMRQSPDAILKTAIRLQNSGELKSAAKLSDQVLKSNPNHIGALRLRASLALAEGDHDIEFSCLDRLLHNGVPLSGQELMALGQRSLTQNDCVSAINFYEQALSNGEWKAADHLIPVYGLQRRSLDVRRMIDLLRVHRPLTIAETSLWLTSDNRLVAPEEAIPQLTAFTQQRLDDLDSEIAVARYDAEEGRRPQAIERLQRQLLKNPTHASTAAHLSLIYLDAGEFTEARQVMQKLPLDLETPLVAWQVLGTIAIHDTDWLRGRVAWQYVTEQAPFDREAWYKLSQCLDKLGEQESAQLIRNKASELNTLSQDVETVGIMFTRNSLNIQQLDKVRQQLLVVGRPLEAAEWAGHLRREDRQTASNVPTSNSAPGRFLDPTRKPPLDQWNALGPASVADSPGEHSRKSTSWYPLQLEDVAESSGVHHLYENGHTGFRYLIETMGGGVLVIDYDRDQRPDLYCLQGGQLGKGPNLPSMSDDLYRNLGNERFTQNTIVAGIHELNYSQGGAVGDFDNDGFDDLFVANIEGNTLWWNNGDGTFDEVTDQAGVRDELMSSSAAFADLDLDGDLDLYVVNYVDRLKICRDDQGQISTCNPSSHDAAEDQLFENLGNGRFADMTLQAQITAPRGKGLGVVVAHLDNDALPDVFVTNDTTPNFLYQNQSRIGEFKFSEIGMLAGVAVNAEGQAEAGMGIACADLDHNLQNDLYVTNFYRESNTLSLQSDGIFTDVSTISGMRELTLPVLGFGCQAIDFDLDGWDELFVTNGHIDDQRSRGVPWKMVPQIFRTSDGQAWDEDRHASGSYLKTEMLGRGVARWDYNGDGRPDLAIGHQDLHLAILKNETSPVGRYVTLRLIGRESNRDGVNAVVRWKMGDKDRVAEVCGGDGYLCSNERLVFIAAGLTDTLSQIEVVWPSGKTDRWTDVTTNARYVAIEGGGLWSDPISMTDSVEPTR